MNQHSDDARSVTRSSPAATSPPGPSSQAPSP
jgi:hypothetical protein